MVDQDLAVGETAEIENSFKDGTQDPCEGALHTEYRRALGQLNWIQSRTQFQIGYRFSAAASAAAKPVCADLKAFNKVIRTVRSQPMKLHIWKLNSRSGFRILGIPNASFKNNADGSSQRGHCAFLAEERVRGKVNTKGSPIDYESKKITRKKYENKKHMKLK